MTLRARLLILIGLISAVLGVIGPVVVQRQHDVLVKGVDELLLRSLQLSSISLGEGTALPALNPGDESTLAPTVTPNSDLFVAVLKADGTSVVTAAGSLISDRPDLTSVDLRAIDDDAYFSVSGEATDQRFRVLLAPNGSGALSVVARPLAQVDSAIRALTLSLVVGGAAVAALLLVLMWWVVRLGLRPIERLTAVATASTGGTGTRRVELPKTRTEAGRLAMAFNTMLDERDRADARLRRFVADVSHELRTPLTSVEGYLELLAHGGIDPADVDGIIRRLRGESHRMRDLVEDLLLLAHLDEGRPMRQEPVDLVGIVRDLAADATVVHPQRRIAVVIGNVLGSAGAELDPVIGLVDGDALRLHQVIAGLLGNALVHTPATADIELRVWAQATGDVAVTVSDNGPGVDAATAATLFDRFSRGDSSRSRRGDHGGFGLGLAIARAIVEAHGGRLTLASSPGAGCAFTMALPPVGRTAD